MLRYEGSYRSQRSAMLCHLSWNAYCSPFGLHGLKTLLFSYPLSLPRGFYGGRDDGLRVNIKLQSVGPQVGRRHRSSVLFGWALKYFPLFCTWLKWLKDLTLMFLVGFAVGTSQLPMLCDTV